MLSLGFYIIDVFLFKFKAKFLRSFLGFGICMICVYISQGFFGFYGQEVVNVRQVVLYWGYRDDFNLVFGSVSKGCVYEVIGFKVYAVGGDGIVVEVVLV